MFVKRGEGGTFLVEKMVYMKEKKLIKEKKVTVVGMHGKWKRGLKAERGQIITVHCLRSWTESPMPGSDF